ncbi:MAG TPA: chloride channel protein, partial [Tepidisphaeraceae bacterium]
ALFLTLLDHATRIRQDHPWLLFLLPLAGAVIAVLYRTIGREAEGGISAILEEIQYRGKGVPAVMAPLILVTTVITHLFGGSAGREGTALQIGGSVASQFGRWLKLNQSDMRHLLMVGVAAGFAGLFGTPVAGAVFAMEVVAAGHMRYKSLFPCLVAGVAGHFGCMVWGVTHTHYAIAAGSAAFDWRTAAKVALAAVLFGLASVLFVQLTRGLRSAWHRWIRFPILRPVVGGSIIIGLTYLLGTRDYLGLGVVSADAGGVSILSSFHAGGAQWLSWWWKMLFTAITISSGFKGGEVTPLFFIGAALGNVLATATAAPVDLFAGLGLVAVFAGATNTPIACTLMAIELFGADHAVYFAMACFISYGVSGRSSIYSSQRSVTAKGR